MKQQAKFIHTAGYAHVRDIFPYVGFSLFLFVDQILSSLPSSSTGLRYYFRANKIATVGQLSRLTVGQVQNMPIRDAADTIHRALVDFADRQQVPLIND